ncbi:hypothetical protein AFEL58S_02078 [Afipia felis]
MNAETVVYTEAEFAALSSDHQAVLERLSVKMRYIDIAADLDIPTGTVRSRINRARKALTRMRDRAAEGGAASSKPFYGAECPAYPNCTGGCGCGCTHEIEVAASAKTGGAA